MARQLHLHDLPDDALKYVLQKLPTDDRRTASLTNHKWQRLVAESWTGINIQLGGTNYLDSASKQIKWLLSLQLQRLHTLHLNLKGVELSGIAVDYLLFPLLDTFEQGAFSQLRTLHLSADMSLPGPLVHSSLQNLYLDMYALTAKVQCPQLLALRIHTISMPGPTLFSSEALSGFPLLNKLHLSFQACYLEYECVSWFLVSGLSMLVTLEQLIFELPDAVSVNLPVAPDFPVSLAHLEMHCHALDISPDALTAMDQLSVCSLWCLCSISGELPARFQRQFCNEVPLGYKLRFGNGPFCLS